MTSLDLKQISKAAALLKEGKLVALPTETVYGLGADASNSSALSKVFLAKERPFTHPLIVHLASAAQLSDWASEVPQDALALAKAFWPGPLTLILKKQPQVLDLLTGGQETVGLRVPAHPVAQALLKAFGGGIAAPSANRYSRLSPTTAEAVREELGSKVDYILEGGSCAVGIESTILDLSREEPTILRPGMIGASALAEVLKRPVAFTQEAAPRVPGMDLVHYAPETRVVLVPSAEISGFLASLSAADLPMTFLLWHKPVQAYEGVNWLVMAEDASQYARDLYLSLRALDKQGFKMIAVETVPNDHEWLAIHDRLRKAAAR